MTKFELGQKVFIIQESTENNKSKCLDCNGEGTIPTRVEGKNVVCPSCRGKKVIYNKPKKKYVPVEVTIESICIYKNGLDEKEIIEEYTTNHNYFSIIFSSNINGTIARLTNIFDVLFDSDTLSVRDSIRLRENNIESISNLYSNKEEAINKCKLLKKTND